MHLVKALVYFKQSTAGFTTSRQEIRTSETTSAVDDHPSSTTTNLGGLSRLIRNLSYKNWRRHLAASISPFLSIFTISATEHFDRDGSTSTDRRHSRCMLTSVSHYSSSRNKRNFLGISGLIMKAGSSTKIMSNLPSGFHSMQSCQQARSRTPPKQASPLRVVEREGTNILCSTSCE